MQKFKIGDKVILGNYKLQITKISSFGETAHYGFLAEGNQGYQAGTRMWLSGWMPCDILDQTGRHLTNF